MKHQQKQTSIKRYTQLLKGICTFIVVVFGSLFLAACSDEECIEGTVDVGVIPIGETALLDTMVKPNAILFLLNDTSTLQFVKGTSSLVNGSKITFQDDQCKVAYTPEIKTTIFTATKSRMLSELRFTATVDFKTKQRHFHIALGSMPYASSTYTTYEYAYFNLDNPVFPLKMDLLNVNGKDFANVKIVTGSSGSYLFFSAENELIEIRMSNGNVLSKIN